MSTVPDPPGLLGGLSIEAFLDDHWQRRPLLVRGALDGRLPGLKPEELAGLAGEPDVDARLVVARAEPTGPALRHGPFDADDFTALPESGWTLLVQAVDRWLPEVAELIEPFRFVPNWRLDDVMVSYAVPGGGVGAHFDRYDVFLLQGPGRRRWEIGDGPVRDTTSLPDADLPVLAQFAPARSWVLEPGDLLYLPPLVAHRGVAVEPALTYSIGFRAPSRKAWIAALLEHALDASVPDTLFGGHDASPAVDPGAIGAPLLDWAGAAIEALADRDHLVAAFGRFLTEPLRGDPEPATAPLSVGRLHEALRAGRVLRRSAVPHFAHVARGDGATLFVGGRSYGLSGARATELAGLVSGRGRLDRTALMPWLDDEDAMALLVELCDRGFVWIDGAPEVRRGAATVTTPEP